MAYLFSLIAASFALLLNKEVLYCILLEIQLHPRFSTIREAQTAASTTQIRTYTLQTFCVLTREIGCVIRFTIQVITHFWRGLVVEWKKIKFDNRGEKILRATCMKWTQLQLIYSKQVGKGYFSYLHLTFACKTFSNINFKQQTNASRKGQHSKAS